MLYYFSGFMDRFYNNFISIIIKHKSRQIEFQTHVRLVLYSFYNYISYYMESTVWSIQYGPLATSMLMTDAGDEMCWWQIDVTKIWILSPKSNFWDSNIVDISDATLTLSLFIQNYQYEEGVRDVNNISVPEITNCHQV